MIADAPIYRVFLMDGGLGLRGRGLKIVYTLANVWFVMIGPGGGFNGNILRRSRIPIAFSSDLNRYTT